MSLYDVTKLSGPVAARGVSRELSGGKAEARPASSQRPADKGIAVQTGARVSAGDAPVNADRVQEIRKALRDGTYPIVPAKISDAIIAARLMLSNAQ